MVIEIGPTNRMNDTARTVDVTDALFTLMTIHQILVFIKIYKQISIIIRYKIIYYVNSDLLTKKMI